jgi:hypothetical protein
LGSIQRQTRATEIAANAAKASADALVNVERAWVVINQVNPPLVLIPQPDPGPLITMWFAFVFKNCGRTIARITDVRIRFHTVTAIEGLPQIPDYREHARALPKDASFGRIVAPNQDFELATVFESNGGIPTDGQIRAIRKGELVLLVYGCVKYLDFTNEPRESQFCYLFKVPSGLVWQGIDDKERWETGGPQGYNRYT